MFDLDGVLVDTMHVIRAAWAGWAADRGLSADEVLASIHMTATELIDRFAPSADPATEIRAIAARQSMLDPKVVAFPGAAQLLEVLPERAWAIVTSARREVAVRHLEMAALPVPAVLISAEDTPRGKPDPAGYRIAAERLRVAPERCLAVEDSPAGLSAALAAGMFAVGITNTHSRRELAHASAIVASLTTIEVTHDLRRIRLRWKDR